MRIEGAKLFLECDETTIEPTIISSLDESGNGSLTLFHQETNIGENGLFELKMKNFTVSNSDCTIFDYQLSSSNDPTILEGVTSFELISMLVGIGFI